MNMAEDFHIAAPIDRRDSCVTARQKIVYNWYESRHSDDEVVDIYSPEWHERITLWYSWCIKTFGTDLGHSENLKLREVPETLDFRTFFFEHPIATFSLWRVFQAFYGFDRALCGTSTEVDATLKVWEEMKPFEYLKCKDVQDRWETDLQKLDAEISRGDLAGERLKSRIYDILHAVERLEAVMVSLEDDFKFDYDGSQSAEWMLDTITNAFDLRCSMISQFLKQDDPEVTYETIVSDPHLENSPEDHFASGEVQPSPLWKHNGLFYSLILLFIVISSISVMSCTNLLVISTRDMAYTIFLIAVGILSLCILSGLQGLENISKNFY